MAVSPKTGQDYNFYRKLSISKANFFTAPNNEPDMIVPFVTAGVIFINEGAGIIEYSFNGTTVHGELDPAHSKTLTFNNRVVSFIWFRLKSGGASNVSVHAWANQ